MNQTWSHHDLAVSIPWHGASLDLKYVSYQYSDGVTTWAYEPALEAFYHHRKKLYVWKVAQVERRLLDEFMEKYDMHLRDHFHPSRKMCQQVADKHVATNYSRHCQTMDTTAFLFQHLVWAACSWKHDSKRLGSRMLAALLARCVPLALWSFQDVISAWNVGLALCDQCGDGCAHLQTSRLPDIDSNPNEHQVIADALATFFPKALACRACMHVVKVSIAQLQVAIDANLSKSAPPTAAHKVERRTTTNGGKRRIDDTFSDTALTRVVRRGMGKLGKSMASLEGLANSCYHGWVRKQMSAYMVATNREASGLGSIGIYEDATSLGKPAKEILVLVGYSAARQKGFVLPPQAPWLLTNMACDLGMGECVLMVRVRCFLCVFEYCTVTTIFCLRMSVTPIFCSRMSLRGCCVCECFEKFHSGCRPPRFFQCDSTIPRLH